METFFYEFTKLSFDNLNRHIRLADNKAKFLLSLNLAVISGISALSFQVAPKLKTETFFSKESLIISLIGVCVVFLFISCIFTVLIIIPKSTPRNNPSKLLYWGQIAKNDIAYVLDKYHTTSDAEKMDELITQIYFYSKSATEKYDRVKSAIYNLFTALMFLFAAVVSSLLLI